MGVDEIIVTWARTRGSTMKFFPVAAATASVICVMSASLKFGVMRPACCAEAIDTTATSNGAQRTKKRKQFTRNSPEAGAPALLRCVRWFRRWWWLRLIGLCALADHSFGFLRNLRYVQCQILLLPAT